MSDVTLTFSGDDKDAQKVFDRQNREIAKLKEKVADLGKTSKKSSDENKRGLEGQIGSLAQMAMGYVSVGAAVAAVDAAYTKWHERMKKMAVDSNKFHSDLLKSLNRAGDLAQGAEVKTALRGISGVKQEEALAAFTAISGAAPQSDLQRRLGVTKGVSRMAPLADVGAMGEVAGELSDLMPGVAPEDIADLTAKMQEQAGGDANKLASAKFLRSAQTLAQTGATDMHGALALGTEALRQNMDPRMVEQVAVAVGSKEEQIKGNGRKLTNEEKLKNQFQKMGAKERLNALMSDDAMRRAVLGEKAAQQLGQIDQKQVDRLAQEQKDAMAGDEVGKRLAAAQTAEPGTFRQREAELKKEHQQFAVEDKARAMEASQAEREGNLADKSVVGGAHYEYNAKGAEIIAGTLGAKDPVATGTGFAEAAPSAAGTAAIAGAQAVPAVGPIVTGLEKIYNAIASKKAVVKGGEQ